MRYMIALTSYVRWLPTACCVVVFQGKEATDFSFGFLDVLTQGRIRVLLSDVEIDVSGSQDKTMST